MLFTWTSCSAERRGRQALIAIVVAAKDAPKGAGDSQLMSAKGVSISVSVVGERGGRGADWGHYLMAPRPRNDLLWSRHGALRPCRSSGRVSLVRLRWVLTFILRLQIPSISRRHKWHDIISAHLQSNNGRVQCTKVNSEVAQNDGREIDCGLKVSDWMQSERDLLASNVLRM